MAISKATDNSFKLIFDDHRLFADFIRDFIHIDILENIKPEDIVDEKERFLPLFQENRDSDTVKRIYLKDRTPLFVIAILEHESQVNYRSCFKMLQYVCLVLDAWEKDAEKEKKGASRLKDFKYPPVLPMILYDGKGPWTAERNFLERTHMGDIFEKYIPKFEYELVNLNDYSEEEIMRFGDALSLVLLVDKNRINKGKGIILPPDYVEKLRLQIPENMYKLLSDVIVTIRKSESFTEPEEEEISAIVDMAKNKEYGGMFEAFLESVKESNDEARAEGMEKGRVEGLEKAAKNALTKGIPIEVIHEITGLDMDTIAKLS